MTAGFRLPVTDGDGTDGGLQAGGDCGRMIRDSRTHTNEDSRTKVRGRIFVTTKLCDGEYLLIRRSAYLYENCGYEDCETKFCGCEEMRLAGLYDNQSQNSK